MQTHHNTDLGPEKQVGWLDYADEEFVRIVWERYPEPNFPKNARLRSTGLAIDRRTILEMRRFV